MLPSRKSGKFFHRLYFTRSRKIGKTFLSQEEIFIKNLLWAPFSFISRNTITLVLRISKRVFQENKARQIFWKKIPEHFLSPDTHTYVSGGKKFRSVFSENLTCFVFLKHPFLDPPFCPITDKFRFSKYLDIAQKVKFSIKDYYMNCDQIRRRLLLPFLQMDIASTQIQILSIHLVDWK